MPGLTWVISKDRTLRTAIKTSFWTTHTDSSVIGFFIPNCDVLYGTDRLNKPTSEICFCAISSVPQRILPVLSHGYRSSRGFNPYGYRMYESGTYDNVIAEIDVHDPGIQRLFVTGIGTNRFGIMNIPIWPELALIRSIGFVDWEE